VIPPALTDPEYMTSRDGDARSVQYDGLRTLLRNVRAATMKEKTLRYPVTRIHDRPRETGFFSKEPIEVNGS